MSMWNAAPDQTQAVPPVTTDANDKKKSDKKHHPEMPVCDTDTYSKCHKMSGVMPPKLLHKEDLESMQADMKGTAVVAVVIDEHGIPKKAILTHPFFFPGYSVANATEMNERALKTARSYRFQPAMLNNQPVPVLIYITMELHGVVGQ
jgi:hypothetical protein